MVCLARNSENILSAAAIVGSSRFAAGVPARDLERRVDFPKEPVSGTARRARDVPGLPSVLRQGIRSIAHHGGRRVSGHTQERAWRTVSVCHPRQRRAPRQERYVG